MSSITPPVVILTGLSGAGKSTALNVFEDLGFFCVDGLPASILTALVTLFAQEKNSKYRGIALGMDLRQLDFMDQWLLAREELDKLGVVPRILFIEAATNVLLRRYATTRRPHPLENRVAGLEQAVAMEREILAPIREQADLVVDTSAYSVHDLRRIIQEHWTVSRESASGLRVHLISFGFKYGVPAEADIVLDLRFLPNPYFDEKLRPFSGKDEAVAKYVFAQDVAREFFEKLQGFLLFLLPLYAKEGRYRLTIGFGCTGGRHRSVAVTEKMFTILRQKGFVVSLEHRHLELG
ncbi:RNase adapter RapZ [Desulfoplanes formicivorans]|uniref:Nucleotide-binding protein n=1 Tax=Desulfoplanes formicivorans TaxID=1592317 RepID=A0A194AFZ8_9BACT|nr:RNase adapter RapZ [Desulfoplanes formicivorans]GAU09007.1 nucleotide-binding protein [Desulfoplanes formicivorans]